MKKYIAFLPLWCNIYTNNPSRYSNGPVENHFRKIQYNVIPSKKLRCSRFVRLLRDYTMSLIKEIDPKKRCASSHERQMKFLEMEIEENWQKKKPTNRKPAYLKPLKDLQRGIKTIAKRQDRVSNTSQATQQTHLTNSQFTNTVKLYKNKNVKDLKCYENYPFNFVCFVSDGIQKHNLFNI